MGDSRSTSIAVRFSISQRRRRSALGRGLELAPSWRCPKRNFDPGPSAHAPPPPRRCASAARARARLRVVRFARMSRLGAVIIVAGIVACAPDARAAGSGRGSGSDDAAEPHLIDAPKPGPTVDSGAPATSEIKDHYHQFGIAL